MRPGARLVVVDRGPRDSDHAREAAAEHHEITPAAAERDINRQGFQTVVRDDRFIDRLRRTTTSGGSSCSASRETRRAAARLLLDRILRIEREIELEHIDARLAKEAELPVGGAGLDEAPDIRLGDAAFAGHARDLEFGGGR